MNNVKNCELCGEKEHFGFHPEVLSKEEESKFDDACNRGHLEKIESFTCVMAFYADTYRKHTFEVMSDRMVYMSVESFPYNHDFKESLLYRFPLSKLEGLLNKALCDSARSIKTYTELKKRLCLPDKI